MTQYTGHKGDNVTCEDDYTGSGPIYSGTKFNSNCLCEGGGNFALYCLIDFPLSLVVDTILLPYTVYSEITDTGYCEKKYLTSSSRRTNNP